MWAVRVVGVEKGDGWILVWASGNCEMPCITILSHLILFDVLECSAL